MLLYHCFLTILVILLTFDITESYQTDTDAAMTIHPKKKALILSYITVSYNIIEGIVSIIAGYLAGSIALSGFGLDSFVESLSGMVMVWRLKKPAKSPVYAEEHYERKAVRLIGYTFFLLAVYVFYESSRKLYLREKPEASLFGIIIAIVSLITMPVLFHQKYRTARELGSRSLMADSKETLACTMLSASLLVGLGLNYLFGLWWTDPVTGLFIVFFLIREGRELLVEQDCGEICNLHK